jgi:hypothetical protein
MHLRVNLKRCFARQKKDLYPVMRRSFRYFSCCPLILGLAGCATLSDNAPETQPTRVDRSIIPLEVPAVKDHRSYLRMMESALEWRQKAASVDGEWRDVGRLIGEAERAAAIGDYARAIDLAERARFQAEMGYRQMKAQEDIENPAFLHYSR